MKKRHLLTCWLAALSITFRAATYFLLFAEIFDFTVHTIIQLRLLRFEISNAYLLYREEMHISAA